MKRILYILSLVMLLGGLEVSGKSYYNSISNQFGGLNAHPGMRMMGRSKAIVDDKLVEENASIGTAITIDTIEVNSSAYRYQLRLANLNNKQGKTMSIKNPMTGERTTITSPEWGLIFNYDNNSGNYCAVVLSCDNSTPYDDITDQRTMKVTIVHRTDNGTHELAQTHLTKGISLEDDMNTICVDVDEHHVTVSIGKNELQQVLEASIDRPAGAVSVGYLVGPGARVAIERAVLTIDNEKQVNARIMWTREDLDAYLEQSADPIEGYWKYLDRDMQDEWLRIGGRYTLAVVRADDGYDIIYIDGAQVKQSLWQCGMLKGHMTKTVFSGNYDLWWIDATMEPIEKDAYATIENGIIMTLNFPVFKSQVRFAKVMSID